MYHLSIVRQLTAMTSAIGLSKSYLVWLFLVPSLVAMLVLVSCGGDDDSPDKVLFIGGIPDQEAATLNRRFGQVGDYLG
ncbi:MAG: hypothetical protein J4F46_07285, partial [Dehalococcoidia bacterium]|nr:hypothetical protein [Dehalococcoidia bacterium]